MLKFKEKTLLDFSKTDWKPADLADYVISKKEVTLENFADELDPTPILFKFYFLVVLVTLAAVALALIALVIFGGELVPIGALTLGLGFIVDKCKIAKTIKIYKRLLFKQ